MNSLCTYLLFLILLPSIFARCPSFKFLSKSGTCEICPPGTYRSATDPNLPQDSPCIRCPRGTFSPGRGAWGPDMCRDCQPGTFSDQTGATSCKPCPEETTSNFRAKRCLQCGPGKRVDKLSTRCISCRFDQFSSSVTNQECQKCPRGTSTRRGGESEDECIRRIPRKCPPGTFDFGNTLPVCTSCPLGTFKPGRDGNCERCLPGSFSRSGATNCTICPTNTFQRQVGGKECKPCKAGRRTFGIGNTECRRINGNCHRSRFADNLGDCRRCEIGYRLNIVRKRCEKCPRGTVSHGGVQAFCITCKNGQVRNDYTGTCTCPKGMELNSEGDGCVPCRRGFASGGRSRRCSICKAGTYSDKRGSTTCKKCPFGQIAPRDQAKKCVPCPKGLIPGFGGNLVARECVSESTGCLSGFTRTNTGSRSFSCEKKACTLGTPMEEFGKSCIPCRKGTVLDNENATCSKCEVERCGSCGILDPIPDCTRCNNVAFSPGGFATECQICPETQVRAFNDGSKCTCSNEFERSGLKNGICEPCPPGFGGDLPDLPFCEPCSPGYFSELGRRCKKCPEGTHSDAPGTAECEPCPTGTAPDLSPGGTRCISIKTAILE